MKQLIRYFTLRKRIKEMLIESVHLECEWQKNYIHFYNDEKQQSICKKRVDEYAFLSDKLRELL